MSGSKPLHGFLDRLREHLEILDEAIATSGNLAKPKQGASSRDTIQGLKILRDLVQERNATLDRIQAVLLGKDETGVTRSPKDVCSGDGQVLFEREFHWMLQPWRESDLLIKCGECGRSSDEVYQRSVRVGVDRWGDEETEDRDLCDRCFKKLEMDFEKERKIPAVVGSEFTDNWHVQLRILIGGQPKNYEVEICKLTGRPVGEPRAV